MTLEEKRPFVPHVFCHNITAYCGSRTKHDQNGNQLVMGKSKSDSNWKKNGAKADQLHKSAGDSCF